MRRFWKHDEGLGELERDLRGLRSGPSDTFVRTLAKQSHDQRPLLRPQLRASLVTVIVLSALGALVWGGGYGVAKSGAKSAGNVFVNLTSAPGATPDAGPKPPPPPPPGGDQYKGKCGTVPPHKSHCMVEVDPDNPKVNAGQTGTNLTFTLTLKGADNTSDQAITVNWTTSPTGPGAYHATCGADYSPCSGSVTFAPGQTQATVTIHLNGEPKGTKDKTFTVSWTASPPGVAQMDGDDNSDVVTIHYG